MSLPYENTTSGRRALDDMRKVLSAFGCSKFATGEDVDAGTVFVQFEHRGRRVHVEASARGYAAAWLRENPWNHRRRGTKAAYEKKAIGIGAIAIYSILRDWIKG